MSASLKPVRGCPIRGLHQLKSKISDLQTRYQHLLNQHQEDIAQLITRLDLAPLEDEILIGGLLFLKDKIAKSDPLMEEWRDAGARFLRRKKTNQQRDAVPQKENRTPQKQSQSREKQDAKTTAI